MDLAPLTDDHQAIEAAGKASRALGRVGAEPTALGGLRTPVAALSGMLDEHIADEEAQVVPAMRRSLTAGACLWCEQQIWRRPRCETACSSCRGWCGTRSRGSCGGCWHPVDAWHGSCWPLPSVDSAG